MIQDSKVLQWFIKHENQKSWIVILFTKPKLYLYNLLKRTIIIGIFLFIVFEIFKYFNIAQSQMIPTSLHSLIGLVIGLLLVFRTNTAYDRWWEARRVFASIHATFIYIRVKFRNSKDKNKTNALACLNKLNADIFKYVSANEGSESIQIKEEFIKDYVLLTDAISQEGFVSSIYGSLEKKLVDILEGFASLERIKDTPIPMSYSFHIKLSIFLFLLSLPFGMFFELGLWSIPCVMVLFFIIAGIEIISNEIENPFKGDPNDLPIEDYKMENEKYING